MRARLYIVSTSDSHAMVYTIETASIYKWLITKWQIMFFPSDFLSKEIDNLLLEIVLQKHSSNNGIANLLLWQVC